MNIKDFEFEYKRAKVTYEDWKCNEGVGQIFNIRYPKYLYDLKSPQLNLHMSVEDSGWVGGAKNTENLTEEDFRKAQVWAKSNIDKTLKLYQRLTTHNGSTKGLAIELMDGIYAIKVGRKSKWFKISPYQYRTRYFQADDVKDIAGIRETQQLGTFLLDIPKGYDKLLVGIGDD
jgi:hypothetical protein